MPVWRFWLRPGRKEGKELGLGLGATPSPLGWGRAEASGEGVSFNIVGYFQKSASSIDFVSSVAVLVNGAIADGIVSPAPISGLIGGEHFHHFGEVARLFDRNKQVPVVGH